VSKVDLLPPTLAASIENAVGRLVGPIVAEVVQLTHRIGAEEQRRVAAFGPAQVDSLPADQVALALALAICIARDGLDPELDRIADVQIAFRELPFVS
jgi:hypothetical protein